MKKIPIILLYLLSATLLHATDAQPYDREITHIEKEPQILGYRSSVYEKCIKGYVFLITDQGGIVQVFREGSNVAHYPQPAQPMPCQQK